MDALVAWLDHTRAGDLASILGFIANANYKIALFNEEGELVEEFTDIKLDRAMPVKKPAFVRAGFIEGLTHRERMEEIYEMARREALDSERVVRGILEALKT